MRLYFPIFALGPAAVGYSLGWLVVHPDDVSGPAVLLPAGLILTALTYRWGIRLRRRAGEVGFSPLLGGMIAGAAMGPILFAMLAFGVLD